MAKVTIECSRSSDSNIYGLRYQVRGVQDTRRLEKGAR